MYEKLKGCLTDSALYTALLLLLVGVIAFGLGRQSVVRQGSQAATAGVVFLDAPQHVADTDLLPVVGSRSGTKYHLPDCPGALQMKPENKLTFDSIALAEAAGYTPAANCPELH